VGALDGFYPIRTDDAGKGSVPTKANVTLAGEPVSATQGRAGAGRLSSPHPERRVIPCFPDASPAPTLPFPLIPIVPGGCRLFLIPEGG